jgi:hypothetical protein
MKKNTPKQIMAKLRAARVEKILTTNSWKPVPNAKHRAFIRRLLENAQTTI